MLWLTFSMVSFGQDMAHLEQNVETLSGKEKLEAYHLLSEHYQDVTPLKSTQYAKEGLALAKENEDPFFIGIFLNDLAMSFYARSDTPQALQYFEAGRAHNEKHQNIESLALSYNGLGLCKNLDHAYADALSYYHEALKTLTRLPEASFKSEAIIRLNLGSIYETLGEMDKALDYYLSGLKLSETLADKKQMAAALNNIGFIHDELGNAKKAEEYYLQSLSIYQELGNLQGAAAALNNVAQILLAQEDYAMALQYFSDALILNEKTGNKTEILTSLNNLGVTYNALSMHEEALSYFEKNLAQSQTLNDKLSIANAYNNMGTTYYYLSNLPLALENHEKALSLYNELSDKEGLMLTFQNLSDDYTGLQDYEKAHTFLSYAVLLKDALFEEAQLETVQNMQIRYETEKKEQENEMLSKDKALLEKDKKIQQIVLGLSALILLVISVLGLRIAKERKKSEKLLLNILPKRVAQDLKKTGQSAPEVFENVTIYFSDIQGFTKTSSALDPKYLIEELSDMFTHFDDIMSRHHCERIKTIGDAYFAVCGMPTKDAHHAENILKASIEILRYLNQRNKTADTLWRIRIGMHSGKVVGGIVGVKKYIYDLFGDTVNTASRMESNGDAMRINVSEETYRLLCEKYPFEKRAPLEVKGKGLYAMYFLDNKAIYGEEEIL